MAHHSEDERGFGTVEIGKMTVLMKGREQAVEGYYDRNDADQVDDRFIRGTRSLEYSHSHTVNLRRGSDMQGR